MISSGELKAAYNELYSQMRKYIWEFETVNVLADIESTCYTAFPDIDHLIAKCAELETKIRHVAKEDEDLAKSLQALRDLLDTEEQIFVKLDQVQEVK